MHILKRTPEFDEWLCGIQDPVTRIRLARRLNGNVLVVMLGGGDKRTQQADIERAIALSRTLEE